MMHKCKVLKSRETDRQTKTNDTRKTSDGSDGCSSLMIDYNHQKDYRNDIVKI